MRRRTFTVVGAVLCWMAATAVASPSAGQRTTVASARVKGGKVAYVQKAHERWRDGRIISIETEFVDPAGQTIARRSVHFGDTPLVPTETYEDLRTGYRTESRSLAGGAVEIKARKAKDEYTDRKVLRCKYQAVNAAGVVEAIRTHWAKLIAGGRIDISLIVPQRLDWYHFRLRKTATGRRSGKATTTFVLEPDNGLLRAIAGQLYFEFDDETGGLARYRGQVDVHDEDGDPLQIDIAWSGAMPGAKPVVAAPPAGTSAGTPAEPKAP